MNEKYVWELWSKCKHPHPKYGGGDMIFPMEFAELIVKECVLQCNEALVPYTGQPSMTHNYAVGLCQDKIKQHFGVEE